MNQPISPYLNRPIRSMAEALDEVEANHHLEATIFAAIAAARADGSNTSRQFQAAVDSIIAKCPELTEPIAVSVVHRVMARYDR